MLEWLGALDLRWLTAIMLILTGTFLVGVALVVWYMPLDRRAQLFGPYLKDDGLKALLRGWPIVFMLGALLTVVGISKYVYYARWNGHVATEFANGVGMAEAILSAVVFGSILILLFRAWRAPL